MPSPPRDLPSCPSLPLLRHASIALHRHFMSLPPRFRSSAGSQNRPWRAWIQPVEREGRPNCGALQRLCCGSRRTPAPLHIEGGRNPGGDWFFPHPRFTFRRTPTANRVHLHTLPRPWESIHSPAGSGVGATFDATSMGAILSRNFQDRIDRLYVLLLLPLILDASTVTQSSDMCLIHAAVPWLLHLASTPWVEPLPKHISLTITGAYKANRPLPRWKYFSLLHPPMSCGTIFSYDKREDVS
jgi:hypothetical protein